MTNFRGLIKEGLYTFWMIMRSLHVSRQQLAFQINILCLEAQIWFCLCIYGIYNILTLCLQVPYIISEIVVTLSDILFWGVIGLSIGLEKVIKGWVMEVFTGFSRDFYTLLRINIGPFLTLTNDRDLIG